MIKLFALNNFVDEHESADKSADFVSFFDRPLLSVVTERAARKAADIEDEARKTFEDAYIQGEKAGREMGMKRVEPLINRLNTDIAALSVFKKDLIDRAEKLATELALMFAEAIVLIKCEEKRDIVINMAKRALEICDGKSGITIRIRREDVQYVSEDSIYPLKVMPDDTLKDPGFIIETSFGDIDGTIATQIEELKKEYINGYRDK